MAYTNEQTQEIRLKSKLKINDYQKNIKKIFKENKINFVLTESDSPFIDFFIETKNQNFVFRVTTSNHEIGVSDNAKFWKVRSDLTGATKNYRQKKNPLSYVPQVFANTYKPKKPTFYIFPVLKPFNNALYNKNQFFIGSFEESFEFIYKKITGETN